MACKNDLQEVRCEIKRTYKSLVLAIHSLEEIVCQTYPFYEEPFLA